MFSAWISGQAMDVGRETVGYDDIWGGGFGPRLQGRLHFGILRGRQSEITVGPGLFLESAGYGTEGGTSRIRLQDGTVLDPQFGWIARFLATLHARVVLPRGFFAGAHFGLGLANTRKVDMDVTDAGGTETKTRLFRESTPVTYDFGIRLGWRRTRPRWAFGFYVEGGLGIVAPPREGRYAGADPGPIRIGYVGVAFSLQFGSMGSGT
jgi:hypothetical protein